MILLGLAVGKGSTPVDDWFQELGRQYRELRYLLVFTAGGLVVALCVAVFVAALLRRRWNLALITAVTPLVAVLAARVGKHAFGRLKEGGLCYPSGHTTATVVVLAMAVLLLGAKTWVLVGAAVVMVLGVIGQSVAYHYFTDAIGALLLGTACVCAAMSLARLDTCQPKCELDHSPR
ncbi:phosphatase PAP2 family protein [Mycolicibacterium vaccae]|uniref:PA-phosphatase-like phosphoesterase n=1 Tax=Mycolicibacterium vaccae ATCC 25954 TaxID=1194972 RepID=K0UN92_MYCVA|nr:phosphatase PAP2 family protein [Mycolicibacterium vaccae]ANI37870.1 PA-phosphatase [Mycolicibacterium vaccae 95051]EJZ08662.1 PA-phosphatase-like phosphoesterase [Mycolicibacterium vaccae ATCC 25954]MCV7059921.1 phosphatase PAP2 family protein [Mycolicibacterium vaccae]